MQIVLAQRESLIRPRPSRCVRRVRSARALIVLSALSALLLSSCGSGSGSSPSTISSEGTAGSVASAQDSAQRNVAPGERSVAGSPPGSADVAKPGAPGPGVAPRLTKSASLDLRGRDISAAAPQVRGIATGLQALVLSEQIGKGGPSDPQPLRGDDEPSGGFGTLTLSVPADKLDTALDQLSRIGTVLRRNTSSQDVTSQYVDTESRLKTMRASVARVRALMTQAKDIGQVVALEGEMSRREADLESLASQLDTLKTSVERSMLAVSLSTPGNEPVADDGLLAGLQAGWDAFTTSARALLTAVGAALPFGVFVALVGAVLWGWWRRRRANRPPVVTASAS